MIITIVVIPLICIITAFLVAFLHSYSTKLKAETASIKNDDTRAMVNSYIDWAEGAVTKIVYALKYSTVDGLKAAGKWDAATTGKMILEQAKSQIAAELTNEVKAAILMINKDFGKWSEDLIEFVVGESKLKSPPTTIPATTPITSAQITEDVPVPLVTTTTSNNVENVTPK
jgi:hypothetical protein